MNKKILKEIRDSYWRGYFEVIKWYVDMVSVLVKGCG